MNQKLWQVRMEAEMVKQIDLATMWTPFPDTAKSQHSSFCIAIIL